jgi:hypothetical protein
MRAAHADLAARFADVAGVFAGGKTGTAGKFETGANNMTSTRDYEHELIYDSLAARKRRAEKRVVAQSEVAKLKVKHRDENNDRHHHHRQQREKYEARVNREKQADHPYHHGRGDDVYGRERAAMNEHHQHQNRVASERQGKELAEAKVRAAKALAENDRL